MSIHTYNTDFNYIYYLWNKLLVDLPMFSPSPCGQIIVLSRESKYKVLQCAAIRQLSLGIPESLRTFGQFDYYSLLIALQCL